MFPSINPLCVLAVALLAWEVDDLVNHLSMPLMHCCHNGVLFLLGRMVILLVFSLVLMRKIIHLFKTLVAGSWSLLI